MKIKTLHRVFLAIAVIGIGAGLVIDFTWGPMLIQGRNFTWADSASFIIIIILFLRAKRLRMKIDIPARALLALSFVYILSAYLNNVIDNSSFHNFIRTLLFSSAYYIFIYNYIKDKEDFFYFHKLVTILAIVIVLQHTWQYFMHEQTLSWKYYQYKNLNAVMANLSLFSVLVLLLAKRSNKILTFGIVFLLVLSIILSISRNGLVFSALLIVGFLLDNSRKLNFKKFLFAFITIVIIISSLYSSMEFIRDKDRDSVMIKMDNFMFDLQYTRLESIHVNVFYKWIDEPTMIILLGDSLSFQHSLIMHVLYTTGLLGTIAIIWFFYYVFRLVILNILNKSAEIRWLLFLFILGTLLSDIITNLRFHSALVGYLTAMQTAVVVKYLSLHKKKEEFSGT